MSRVLVADDRSVNRELLVRLLQHAGHEVVEAGDGVEALESAIGLRPDAMVIDFAMPRLDGMSLARIVRSLPTLQDIPILFYTGTADRPEAEEAVRDIGRSSILLKPSEPEVILESLRILLGLAPGAPAQAGAPDPFSFQLSALLELALELTARRTSREILETAARRAAEVMRADLVAVDVGEETQERFTAVRGSRGGWEPFPRDGRYLAELLGGDGVRAGVVPKAALALLRAPTALQSAIVAALSSDRRHHGTIWFGRSVEPFSDRDLRLASAIAVQLALAYENALLHEAREEELQRSADIMKAVFDLAPVAVVAFGPDLRVTLWNRAAESMFGWAAGEVIGRPPAFVPEGRRDELQAVRARVQQGELVSGVETQRRRRDGTLVDVAVSAVRLPGAIGTAGNVLVIYNDISPMKRIEADLAAQAAQLRALSERLLRVQEAERTSVAREIHDELGQLLTAAKLEVSAMQLPGAETAARAGRAADLIDQTLHSVRRIATALRPAVLDQFGFVAAVENEVALFQQRTGIECDLSIRPPELHIDRDCSTALFRVIQEALTNVVRHAGAGHVEIRVRQSAGETLVEVRDDGVGIDADSVHAPRSLGLVGARERVREFSGSVAIEGVAGKGTIFTVRIPAGRSA